MTSAGFLLNWLTVLVIMPMSGVSVSVSDFFLATLVAVVGIPFTWKGWYRGLYRASQTDGSFTAYMRVFILLSVHVVWCIWTIIAPPGDLHHESVTFLQRFACVVPSLSLSLSLSLTSSFLLQRRLPPCVQW